MATDDLPLRVSARIAGSEGHSSWWCRIIRVAQVRLVPSHQLGITEEFHTIADCIATGCLLAGLRGWLWTRKSYRRWISSWRFGLAPAVIVLVFALNVHPTVKWLIGIPLFNLSVAVCIDHWTRFPNTDPVGRLLNSEANSLSSVYSATLCISGNSPSLITAPIARGTRFHTISMGAFLWQRSRTTRLKGHCLALRYKSGAGAAAGSAAVGPQPSESESSQALQ